MVRSGRPIASNDVDDDTIKGIDIIPVRATARAPTRRSAVARDWRGGTTPLRLLEPAPGVPGEPFSVASRLSGRTTIPLKNIIYINFSYKKTPKIKVILVTGLYLLSQRMMTIYSLKSIPHLVTEINRFLLVDLSLPQLTGEPVTGFRCANRVVGPGKKKI